MEATSRSEQPLAVDTPRRRVIVVPIIRDAHGSLLICRMPKDRGVFPGQWGLPGGGVESGERIDDAVHRETNEELGLRVQHLRPLFFKDAVREKHYAAGRAELLHMVFLIYACDVDPLVAAPTPRLNDEFDAFAWVQPAELRDYDLNSATIETFRQTALVAE
jgi:nucleoside triphosphatase